MRTYDVFVSSTFRGPYRWIKDYFSLSEALSHESELVLEFHTIVAETFTPYRIVSRDGVRHTGEDVMKAEMLDT